MYLFGASGHGKVVAEIAVLIGKQIEGFIDMDLNKTELLGYTVSQHLPNDTLEVFISIGNNQVRKRIVSENVTFNYPVLIHKNTNLSEGIQVGRGTVIMAGVTINIDSVVGDHCIINTNSSIDHDCVIDNFVHISPNVALAGNVVIGEGTHIGIGACIIQGIKVGNWCTIGAGAVIIRDVPDGCTVVGNPGRIIKK